MKRSKAKAGTDSGETGRRRRLWICLTRRPQYIIANGVLYVIGNMGAGVSIWICFRTKLLIDGSVQERLNPSVLAMELRLSCTNPSLSSHAKNIYWAVGCNVLKNICTWYHHTIIMWMNSERCSKSKYIFILCTSGVYVCLCSHWHWILPLLIQTHYVDFGPETLSLHGGGRSLQSFSRWHLWTHLSNFI